MGKKENPNESNNRALVKRQSGDLDPITFAPVSKAKQEKFLELLKNILPYIGSDEGKIVLTEVMVALKLEGIIGKRISDQETQMVHLIKESILVEPDKKAEALKVAKRLLK